MIDLRRITSPQVEGADALIRAVLQSMQEDWKPTEELRHHRRFGTDLDREAATRYLSTRYGGMIDPGRVFLTNGTWNALFMLVKALSGECQMILTEASTYTQVRDVAEFHRLRLVGIGLDSDGLIPEELEDACRRHRPKLLYCIPTSQNPTASIMSLGRRKQIIDIARRHDLTIIEDEAQGLVRADVPPPLSAIAPDITWNVMGLSKCFFVGTRVAYVVAPNPKALTEAMKRFDGMAMWYASTLSATLLTRAILSGAADTLLGKIQNEATRRRSLAAGILPPHIMTGTGALSLYLSDRRHSGNALVNLARDRGVLVRSGSEFSLRKTEYTDGIRVSLADVPFGALQDGLARLASIFDDG